VYEIIVMWHTISYVSTSRFDINKLIDETKQKNEDLGITGILMHSGQKNFQIIEGEKKSCKKFIQKYKDI